MSLKKNEEDLNKEVCEASPFFLRVKSSCWPKFYFVKQGIQEGFEGKTEVCEAYVKIFDFKSIGYVLDFFNNLSFKGYTLKKKGKHRIRA